MRAIAEAGRWVDTFRMKKNVATIMLAMLSCASCSNSPNDYKSGAIMVAPRPHPPSSSQPATEAAITAHLQRKVRHLAIAYPQAGIINLRFNASRTAACGLLKSPGEQKVHLILSLDIDPSTVADRGLSLPFLTRDGDWRRTSEATARLEASNAELCAMFGVLPDQFVISVWPPLRSVPASITS